MIRNTKEEGHYTIKRVDTLPKKGNANWLYILKGDIIDRLYRYDAFEKEYQTIFINSQGFIPEDTILEFNSNTNILTITFTDGMTKSVELDIKGYVTIYTDSTGIEKSKIGEYLNEEGVVVDINETNTNIRLEGNSVVYNREDSTETTVDLTPILDQALDVALNTATYVEALSTIVLTLNNGSNVSVTLTGLATEAYADSKIQTLTLTGTDLNISQGNTVDLSSLSSPTITNTSELINDGADGINAFITENDVPSNNSELINDSDFITLAEVPNETLTSLSISGETLSYTDEDGVINSIPLPATSGGSTYTLETIDVPVSTNNHFSINLSDGTSTNTVTLTQTTGLEAIDEGNGTGWRLIGRDPALYGAIGEDSIDLSTSSLYLTTAGATGSGSTVSGGAINTASGDNSTVSGGVSNTASDYVTTVSGGSGNIASGNVATVSGGFTNTASGDNSTVSGGINNTASGRNSTVLGGESNKALSFGEISGGVYSTDYTPSSSSSWYANDRLFNLGNGPNNIDKSDALTVYKSGAMQLHPIDLTTFTAQLGMMAIDINDSNKLKFYDGTVWNALF